MAEGVDEIQYIRDHNNQLHTHTLITCPVMPYGLSALQMLTCINNLRTAALVMTRALVELAVVGALTRGLVLLTVTLTLQLGLPLRSSCVCGPCHIVHKLLPLIHVSIFSLYSSLAACDHFGFFSPSSLSLEAKAVSMVRAACTVLLIYGLQFGYILFLWGHHPLDASR